MLQNKSQRQAELLARLAKLLRYLYDFERAMETARIEFDGKGPTRAAQRIRRALVAAGFPGSRNLRPATARRKRAACAV